MHPPGNLSAAQHRHADGFHGLRRFADEKFDDVEIVDHHVVDDARIHTAPCKGGQAVAFDEAGCADDVTHFAQHRIETLEMAYLRDHARLVERPHQASPGRDIGRKRFFDQHVHTFGGRRFGHARVRSGRHDDAHRLDSVQ
jgi:hypothetical protein